MNYKPPYTITTKIVNLISQISEELTKIEIDEQRLITPNLRKINRIKTLAGTLEIEGNFLGEEKITAILDGKTVLGTFSEITEAKGAIEAYKEFENYNPKNLTDMLKAHHILMKDMINSAGNFRSINVGVGGKDGVAHIAPPPNQVPKLMKDLFDWLGVTDEHPLITSSVFHYEFEFIHPFSDGNGRIGRLWQSVILYNWKKAFIAIPTESIIRDHQEEYYQAIENSTNLGESTPFIEFMLEVILESIQSSVTSNQKSSHKSDQKVLELVRQNSKITIKELMQQLSMSESGIKKVIKKLKVEKRLQRVGSLKDGRWEVL
jgi:Fic family protein